MIILLSRLTFTTVLCNVAQSQVFIGLCVQSPSPGTQHDCASTSIKKKKKKKKKYLCGETLSCLAFTIYKRKNDVPKPMSTCLLCMHDGINGPKPARLKLIRKTPNLFASPTRSLPLYILPRLEYREFGSHSTGQLLSSEDIHFPHDFKQSRKDTHSCTSDAGVFGLSHMRPYNWSRPHLPPNVLIESTTCSVGMFPRN
jgi:hypothetical protein